MPENSNVEPKQIQVAPFGLILGENVATGSGKPLECPPGPKTPPGGPGGSKGAQGGPAPWDPLFPYVVLGPIWASEQNRRGHIVRLK